jgi:hypothetical protein
VRGGYIFVTSGLSFGMTWPQDVMNKLCELYGLLKIRHKALVSFKDEKKLLAVKSL